jgi:2-keto-4-pentenoate hydratase
VVPEIFNSRGHSTRGEISRRTAQHHGAGCKLPGYHRGGLEPSGAYAVQAINTQAWLRSGRRIVGRKVGLTAAAVQAQLGVDQPDFGMLFEDMQVPDGGVLDPARTLQAKSRSRGGDRAGP